MNESIGEKTLHLNAILAEESRAKHTIEALDEEKELLAELKNLFIENLNLFKQNMDNK